MKKLLTVTPSRTDGCAYYRSVGPLSQLRNDGWEMVLPNADFDLTWGTLSQYDALFLQRPYLPDHLTLAKMAKPLMPIWVDIDDLVWDLPQCNPNFDRMMTQKVLDVVDATLSLADVITTSTEALAITTSRRYPGANVRVVPNAHNNYWFPQQASAPLTPMVFWRGTNTHQCDLLEYANVIVAAKKRHPETRFVFMGTTPWMLTGRMEYERAQGVDMFRYLQLLSTKIRPALTIVPLADNQFNRCKSNVAWVEAGVVGGRVIAPDWPEWQQDGIANYRNPATFLEILSAEIAAMQETPVHIHVPLLSATNTIRLNILETLT